MKSCWEIADANNCAQTETERENNVSLVKLLLKRGDKDENLLLCNITFPKRDKSYNMFDINTLLEVTISIGSQYFSRVHH